MSPFDQVQAAFGPSLSSTNRWQSYCIDLIVETVSSVRVVSRRAHSPRFE